MKIAFSGVGKTTQQLVEMKAKHFNFSMDIDSVSEAYLFADWTVEICIGRCDVKTVITFIPTKKIICYLDELFFY